MCLLVGCTTFVHIVTGPVLEVIIYFDYLVCLHRLARGFYLNF